MNSPYTKTAAIHLLPFAVSIEAVREFKNCIQCTYQVHDGRRCSTFLSKKAFISYQSQIRVEGAKAIEITSVRGNGEYVVYSTKSNTYYVVRPDHDDPRQRCECGDCHYRAIKCKHQVVVEEFKLQSFSLVPVSIPDQDSYMVASATTVKPQSTGDGNQKLRDLGMTQEAAFANGFGWMPIKPNLDSVEKYYEQQRIQIWKLASKYWGMYGHFWIVDSSLGAVVAVVQSNGKGCYESAYVKREKYMNLIASI